jgi:hypothetical protein
MKKNKTSEQEVQDLRELYKDERTEERIQEHLTNEHDVITEEDIANAPTGIVENKELHDRDAAPEHKDKKEELEEEAKLLAEKKIRPNDDPNVETPWNVLGS